MQTTYALVVAWKSVVMYQRWWKAAAVTKSLFSTIISCFISSFIKKVKGYYHGPYDLIKLFSFSIKKIHVLFCLFLPGRGSYSKLPNEEQRLQQENDRMVSNLATKISTLKNVSVLLSLFLFFLPVFVFKF